MATYPLQGIYKSIWASAKPNTQRYITIARRAEGSYLAAKARANGTDDQVVVNYFDAMIHNDMTSHAEMPSSGEDGFVKI